MRTLRGWATFQNSRIRSRSCWRHQRCVELSEH